MKKRTQYNFELIEVLAFLYKWKKQLLIICIAAAALSYLASGPWLIKPKFRAAATFYPGTVNSISSALFFKLREKARDPLMFGEVEETEQFMQLLESGDLKARIIQKFDLMNHYHIDPANPNKNYLVDIQYNKNIKVKRTDFNSIEISVLDENPQMSADIANGVMMMADTIKTEIKRRVALQAYDIILKEYDSKVTMIDSLKDVMKEMGAKGVYALPEQSIRLSESGGAPSSDQRKALGEYSGEYTLVYQMLRYEAENLSELRMRLEQSKVDARGELSNIFIVGKAYTPDQKATPVRSIIVLLSVLSAFVMSCIVIVMLEKYKEYQKLTEKH
jgi:capsular polysaccharide biosynthesis protein